MPKRLTTKTFIEAANHIHGNLYNYESVEYINAHTKVVIGCEKHGNFTQTPTSHISGKSGCGICGRDAVSEKLSNHVNAFITRAINVHANKYDYSLVKYKNTHTKVKIHCYLHGVFHQSPHSHLSGHGCPGCGTTATANSKRTSKKQFIESANIVHEFKYDYTLVEYTNTDAKVNIICPHHGVFSQRCYSHLHGIGCKRCTTGRYDYNSLSTDDELGSSAGTIYLFKLYHDNEMFYKVGITTNLNHRKRHMSGHYNINIIATARLTLLNCFILEQNIIHNNCSYQPSIVFGGHTECLSLTDIEVDDIVDVLNSVDDNHNFVLINT